MSELASQPETDTDLAGAPARLTRLTDTLRRRDWLGTGIELAVVTLGVLLAFQIDQWGDRRKQAQEEQQLLGRLYFEYQRAIESHAIKLVRYAQGRNVRMTGKGRKLPLA